MPNKKTARPIKDDAVPRQLSLLDLAESACLSELKTEDAFIRELSGMCRSPLEVTFTRNRSSLISIQAKASGLRNVRLQHGFRAADCRTMKSLASYISSPNKRSGKVIDEFIREKQDLFETMAKEGHRSSKLRVAGRFKKLDSLLRKVIKDYEFKLRGVKITWGRESSVSGNHSIKFGSYSHRSGTVTIHPALDSPDVPDYFVEYIIYHELLHAIFPPQENTGSRRSVHSPEFKRFEKKFSYYNEALEFEKWFVKNRLR